MGSQDPITAREKGMARPSGGAVVDARLGCYMDALQALYFDGRLVGQRVYNWGHDGQLDPLGPNVA